ncbi:MAG TPA: Crp/Fnr family transcriptional regulator [Steroidobacteraceae bacterium]|nr:Crp/Fnr family transcriptional regulator [Steroidobacteraceae bacterium]
MKEKSAVDEFLSRHGWLSFTSPEFRVAVLARLELHDFDKGEPVYRAGDPPGGLWALVEGTVEIEGASPGAAPHLMHLGVPGFWFGEGPLIFGVNRLVSVNAGRPSTLVTLPLADCRAMLCADPAAWRWIALLSLFTADLAGGVVADLLLRDPVKRTAALLLRLAGVRSLMFRSDRAAPIYLSQEKLGSLMNLSRNSIIPVLHDFERNGYIEISYGAIQVRNIAGLQGTIARDS